MAQTELAVWAEPRNNSPASSGDEEQETHEKTPKTKDTSISQKDWRTGVEDTITGLSDSLHLVNESLATLVKASSKKKRSKPASKAAVKP